MFPSRNPLPKRHQAWSGTTPMSWNLVFAGAVLAIIAVAGVI